MNFKISRLPNTEDILKAVKDNGNYCPCRTEKTEENKCICKEFLDMQFEGDCHCGLYTKTFKN